MQVLLTLAGFAACAVAQTPSMTTTTMSSSSALTTLPSSTSFSSTGSLSLSGISTASNGSLSVTATSAPITPSASATPIVVNEYKLKVHTKPGAPARFDGQYLGGWSLFANLSADAILVKEKAAAAKFFLNGTNAEVDFGTGLSWGMSIVTDGAETRWYGVNMRYPIRSYIGSFFMNSTGLQWTPNETPPPHNGSAAELDNYFGGWIACDWWHDVPQLFWLEGLIPNTTLPSSCGGINLIPTKHNGA